MKLHELKPAEGSRKVRNRVGRGTGSSVPATEKLQDADTRDKMRVAAAEFVRVLKADRCRFIVVYRNADSKISGLKSTQKLMSRRSIVLMTVRKLMPLLSLSTEF